MRPLLTCALATAALALCAPAPAASQSQPGPFVVAAAAATEPPAAPLPSAAANAPAVDTSVPPPAPVDPGRLGSPYADGEEDVPRRRVRKHPRWKSDILLPLPSVLLPGFGQYFQGDWTGAVYTGVAVGGVFLELQGLSELITDEVDNPKPPDLDPGAEDPSTRKILLGGLAYQGSGFLSAYSVFRLSVPRFQQENGRYLFLTQKETVGDLLISPFRFDHLLKPTAFIPLGLLAGGALFLTDRERSRHKGADWTLSGDDFLFTGALAYNAGASEEALFRGWLYPMGYQYMGRNFWLANGAQALLFGAAHYNSETNPVPWPQAVLGFYFGWLAQRNQWTLSESIFVHSWWDMILFAATVATTRKEPAATAHFDLAMPIAW